MAYVTNTLIAGQRLAAFQINITCCWTILGALVTNNLRVGWLLGEVQIIIPLWWNGVGGICD